MKRFAVPLPELPILIRWTARCLCTAWLLSGAAAGPAHAQGRDTLASVLPGVEIEASRLGETEATAPYAVSVLSRPLEEVALEPAQSLDDVLNPLPGVWANDRGHYALGERLVVRGMGWRSQFGVRGVQVLLDGIPLTMPDGQAIMDVVDPSLVRRAELVRGPASLLWGNAAGGVLALTTEPSGSEAYARGRVLAGSYGVRQLTGEAYLTPGPHTLHAYASDARQEGFRAYSEGRFTRAGLHVGFDLGRRSRLKLTGALAKQNAQNPGSLTAAEVLQDRRMANRRNVETLAGKESAQLQGAATLLHETGAGTLSAVAYGLVRDLQNPLSYAYIDVFRRAGGTRLSLQSESGRLTWGAGADLGYMADERFNWDNVAGQPGGDRLLDQMETVLNAAVFGTGTWLVTERLSLTAGLRGDRIRFDLEDRLPGDGDQSGDRLFTAWSPSLGAAYRLGDALAFANFSTAFETPTTTELVNRPDSSRGFNADLEPQRTRGFEMGLRGALPDARLRYDVALYRLDISNGIIPFEDASGREFFRNTGENLHRGVEIALEWQALESVALQASYTGSRLTLQEEPFEGNQVPGVPEHRLYSGVRVETGSLWARLGAEAVSGYPVDNANETENEGYVLLDLNVGWSAIELAAARVAPFVRLGNLLGVQYSNSVAVNAFGARYFEPSPGRTVQAGLNLLF
jgi:iron complex outermembrane recepter protein